MKKKLLVLLISIFALCTFAFTLSACEDNPTVPPSSEQGSEQQGGGDDDQTTDASAFIVEGSTIIGLTDYGKTLTEIVIPKKIDGVTITSIGERAFFLCLSLEAIEIPNSVTSIDYFAFAGCYSLEAIEIPNSVTSIGDRVFAGCESLKTIEMPNSLTSIGSDVFEDCDSLTSIIVDEDNSVYKSVDGNLYSKDGTILIQYAVGKTQTFFTIPSSVTSIGEDAFNGYASLKSIVIPNSVTSIGNSAFVGCGSLQTVTFEENSQLTNIGEKAFYFCHSLTSIAIPNSATSIGKQAFSDCSSLTNITISNNLTNIGSHVFNFCDSLIIYCEVTEAPSGWSSSWNSGRPIVWNCKNNEVATDGSIYAVIDNIRYALKDGKATVVRQSRNITTANIPASLTYKGTSYLVTIIGDRAFKDCDSLTSVTIEDSVTSIGSYAFEYCSSLTSIEIPNSVTSIGGEAFNNCSSLTSITIPNSVTSIGEYAFYGCRSLTIYCEAESKPIGWDSSWNYSNRPVVWGHNG